MTRLTIFLVFAVTLVGSSALAEPNRNRQTQLDPAKLDALMDCDRVGQAIPAASPRGRACQKLLAALDERREPSEYLTMHCDITGIRSDGKDPPCLGPYRQPGESNDDYNIRMILLSKLNEADNKTKEAWDEIHRVNVEEQKAEIQRYIRGAEQ
jgi:hypothetical protein